MVTFTCFVFSFSMCYLYISFFLSIIFIPSVYEVYRGYIMFAFSVCLCVCKLFFPSKISQELLDLGS